MVVDWCFNCDFVGLFLGVDCVVLFVFNVILWCLNALFVCFWFMDFGWLCVFVNWCLLLMICVWWECCFVFVLTCVDGLLCRW